MLNKEGIPIYMRVIGGLNLIKKEVCAGQTSSSQNLKSEISDLKSQAISSNPN
jgi:hypothetical protein